MSLTKNSAMSAEEVIQLKKRVKAELQRRNRYSNISSYGGSAYDYEVQPSSGNPLKYEHISKIIDPLKAVNSDTVAQIYGDIKQGQRPKALDGTTGDTIKSFLTVLEGDSKVYNGTNHCKGQCSGLCVGWCDNSCSGCSGSCGDSCSYDCDSQCVNTSKGGCGGRCTGTCTGYCGNCGGCGKQCNDSVTTCAACNNNCVSSNS